MNSSIDLDDKEIELQKQKEIIGQMRSTHAGGRKRDEPQQQQQQQTNEIDEEEEERGKEEKENVEKPIYQDYLSSLETPEVETNEQNNFRRHDESDNVSTLSMNGSSPETLPRNDIPDLTQNGSADSSDAAGSPVSTPLNPETTATIHGISTNSNSNHIEMTPKYGVFKEGNDKQLLNKTRENISTAAEVAEADDELSSNDGNSFDTVKHLPMGNKLDESEINFGSTTKALETLKKSQDDLKRRAQEEENERLRAQQTYVLPSVLSYNQTPKKVDSDSDSDAELFATDPCRQCESIRKDPRMKTKVCTLM